MQLSHNVTLLAARSLPGNLFSLLSQAVIEGSAVPLFLVLFTAYLLLSDQWICDVSSPGGFPAPVSFPAWVVPDGAGPWLPLLGVVSSEVEWTLMPAVEGTCPEPQVSMFGNQRPSRLCLRYSE